MFSTLHGPSFICSTFRQVSSYVRQRRNGQVTVTWLRASEAGSMHFTEGRWSRESNPLITETSDGCKERPEISEEGRTQEGACKKEKGSEARACEKEERKEGREKIFETQSGKTSCDAQKERGKEERSKEKIRGKEIRSQVTCEEARGETTEARQR
jgi:hypothetical protein